MESTSADGSPGLPERAGHLAEQPLARLEQLRAHAQAHLHHVAVARHLGARARGSAPVQARVVRRDQRRCARPAPRRCPPPARGAGRTTRTRRPSERPARALDHLDDDPVVVQRARAPPAAAGRCSRPRRTAGARSRSRRGGRGGCPPARSLSGRRWARALARPCARGARRPRRRSAHRLRAEALALLERPAPSRTSSRSVRLSSVCCPG